MLAAFLFKQIELHWMILDYFIVKSLLNGFASCFSWNILMEVELPPPSRFLMAQESNLIWFGFDSICFVHMIHIPEHHGSTRSHPFTRKSDTKIQKPKRFFSFCQNLIDQIAFECNSRVTETGKNLQHPSATNSLEKLIKEFRVVSFVSQFIDQFIDTEIPTEQKNTYHRELKTEYNPPCRNQITNEETTKSLAMTRRRRNPNTKCRPR